MKIVKIGIRAVDFSDRELLNLAREYGSNAKAWLRQFAGLLPEIYERGLYKKEGFVSIHQYAKMVAGMNEATVDRILNLRLKLKEKPALLSLFESGGQGWSKLEKVATIATVENDAALAQVVEALSYRTLDGYVKGKKGAIFGAEELDNNRIIRQIYSNYKFRLSIDVKRKLQLIKQKFEKEKKEALTWNETFKYWAVKSESHKVELIVCADCAKKKGQRAKTRAIPEDVKRFIRARYGYFCPICDKPWTHFHHKKRYAKYQTHDPDFIVPLCKIHHDMVHEGLVANEDDPPWKWYFRDAPKLSGIDRKVRIFKNAN